MDSSHRVLVIDDDPDVLRILETILKTKGYAPRSTSVVGEALQLLREESFDAVLCDFWMPGFSGKDFYEFVNVKVPRYKTRFIVITGDGGSQYAWDFIEDHRLPYVMKPFDIPSLLETLEEVESQPG